MVYDFNQLDPVKFQRLINCILVAHFGEDARLTPLRGEDGGKDGETAPLNPYFEFQVGDVVPSQWLSEPPRKGRYLFQVKHHRTTDKRLSDIRQEVASEFAQELQHNVMRRKGDERVNYFFLITNVPSSKDAIAEVDQKRRDLNIGSEGGPRLHADVWWQEAILAFLDQMPSVWSSFPEIFPGGRVPLLAEVVGKTSTGLPRALRLAISHQYDLDKHVKFRQIELEQELSKLFVDLDVDISEMLHLQPKTAIQLLQPAFPSTDSPETEWRIQKAEALLRHGVLQLGTSGIADLGVAISFRDFMLHAPTVSGLGLLMNAVEQADIRKIVLEGGPGQGKSTITQMIAQIHRHQILGEDDLDPEGRWKPLLKSRLPFRIELRKFAEWLTKNRSSSVEQYLAFMIMQDSGGNQVSVDEIHTIAETSPVLLIFDGLDEVGSDDLRDDVLTAILECIHRFEKDLHADLRIIITTRPPAMTGRRERLFDFGRVSIAPMGSDKVEQYVTRWLAVQVKQEEDKQRVRESFERRQSEPHVQALAKNPMQLSVLLQLIRLKGEAFPARRAELYRDYFQIVIDRDVEKSSELRENRQIIEALHEFLGYKLHALTEVNQADRTLNRTRLLGLVQAWLHSRGDNPEMAGRFFRLGEERFGLIVAPRGEGEETRYGYEVQPVQEYFAAAYISNQIPPSNSHNVFEAMIRRPNWKEVALFLAGLRRPNEKADLTARARKLDEEPELGWRQDGRAIILQMLQEGVLSEPRYVFSQALDFVLDLLDSRKVKIQHEPQALTKTLVALFREGASGEHKGRLLTLLEDLQDCQDRYVIERLYGVARHLLSPDELRKQILLYAGHDPDLIARIHLEWPYTWKITMDEAVRDPSFWKGVPESLWAKAWWNSALLSGWAYDLPVPPHFHQCLAEQFAISPITICQQSQYDRPFIEVSSSWAIWRLVACQQMLHTIGYFGQKSDPDLKQVTEQILSRLQNNSAVDLAGLDSAVRQPIKDLVELSEHLLQSMCTDDGKESASLMNYTRAIQEYLELPGLTSWLACRCAMILIRSIAIGKTPLERMPVRRTFGTLETDIAMEFSKAMIPFYTLSITHIFSMT